MANHEYLSGTSDSPIPVLNYAKKQPTRVPWRPFAWTLGLLIAAAVADSSISWGDGEHYCTLCARRERLSYVRVAGMEWQYGQKVQPGWMQAWIEKAQGAGCTHSWTPCASRFERTLLSATCCCHFGSAPQWSRLASPELAPSKQSLFDRELARDSAFLSKLQTALATPGPASRQFFDDLWIKIYDGDPAKASIP